MDAETAYDVLRRLSQSKKEVGSLRQYLKTNAVILVKVIGVGGFGIAIAIKNPKDVISVLKLIPLNDEKVLHVLREVLITAHLSSFKASKGNMWGFPEYHGCAIVKGRLSAEVLSLLDDFGGDEYFTHPDIEKWLAIEMEYGGNSLRQYARAPDGHLLLDHHGCALSVLAQVINTLAEAERCCWFEHRDCHWENILIFEDVSRAHDRIVLDSCSGSVSLRSFGLKVMLIDFGLSRCRTPHGFEYFDLSRESPDIFQQSGTVQYEVYKKMHAAVGDAWRSWHPRTNALWIDYLLDKLSNRVGYRDHLETGKYKSFMEELPRTFRGGDYRWVLSARGYREALCQMLTWEKIGRLDPEYYERFKETGNLTSSLARRLRSQPKEHSV